MDKKQVADQLRQFATFLKIQAYGSHWSEVKEHLIVWTLIPFCASILFHTYVGKPFLGWWEYQVIGGLRSRMGGRGAKP